MLGVAASNLSLAAKDFPLIFIFRSEITSAAHNYSQI